MFTAAPIKKNLNIYTILDTSSEKLPEGIETSDELKFYDDAEVGFYTNSKKPEGRFAALTYLLRAFFGSPSARAGYQNAIENIAKHIKAKYPNQYDNIICRLAAKSSFTVGELRHIIKEETKDQVPSTAETTNKVSVIEDNFKATPRSIIAPNPTPLNSALKFTGSDTASTTSDSTSPNIKKTVTFSQLDEVKIIESGQNYLQGKLLEEDQQQFALSLTNQISTNEGTRDSQEEWPQSENAILPAPAPNICKQLYYDFGRITLCTKTSEQEGPVVINQTAKEKDDSVSLGPEDFKQFTDFAGDKAFLISQYINQAQAGTLLSHLNKHNLIRLQLPGNPPIDVTGNLGGPSKLTYTLSKMETGVTLQVNLFIKSTAEKSMQFVTRACPQTVNF